ncbi:MAG TPA: serine hydrolase, partial [Tepidisphaeraceae bacterium]|nr:serine hydrolase [Tepidisphaeraceae bacterium]
MNRLAPSAALFVLLIVAVAAADQTPLQVTAGHVARQITKDPGTVATLYAPSFLNGVPEEKLVSLYQTLYAQHGGVLHVLPMAGASATAGKFTFAFKDVDIPVSLSIEDGPAHRVVELWFGLPVPRLHSLQEASAELAKLPGRVSFQLQRLDDGKVLASHDPDTALAIGSTFKLYVLATLIHEKVPWDKVTTLQQRYKSVGGGDMENWPVGSPVTMDTLAVQMISKSDNTAADHLLALAGRENVEAMLPALGMKNPSADVPFLSTRELFRLKTDSALRSQYLSADQAGRERLLKTLPHGAPPDVAQLMSQGPTAIDTVEWFASAADLCRLLQWYDTHADATAL